MCRLPRMPWSLVVGYKLQLSAVVKSLTHENVIVKSRPSGQPDKKIGAIRHTPT